MLNCVFVTRAPVVPPSAIPPEPGPFAKKLMSGHTEIINPPWAEVGHRIEGMDDRSGGKGGGGLNGSMTTRARTDSSGRQRSRNGELPHDRPARGSRSNRSSYPSTRALQILSPGGSKHGLTTSAERAGPPWRLLRLGSRPTRVPCLRRHWDGSGTTCPDRSREHRHEGPGRSPTGSRTHHRRR